MCIVVIMLYIKVETCFFFSFCQERRSLEHRSIKKYFCNVMLSMVFLNHGHSFKCPKGEVPLYFDLLLFCLQNYKVVLTFKSVDEIFQRSFQNNIQHSCKTVHYAARYAFLTLVPMAEFHKCDHSNNI